MKVTILTDRYNYLSAVKEEKEKWIESILAFIGIDLSSISQMPKDKVVDLLVKNKIFITHYPSIDAVRIEYDGDLIGEWAGPEMSLKYDDNGELYYEIEIDNWSVLDEAIDAE